MNLTAYRKEREMTQKQLAEELAAYTGRPYDKAFISKVESGLANLPKNVVTYLNSKIVFKAVATGVDERNSTNKVIVPPPEKKSLKSDIPKNWNAKGLNQKERILGYIDEQGSITSKEAFDYLGIGRLASRIFDLEREGYRFNRQAESAPNRFGKSATYTRYSFMEAAND